MKIDQTTLKETTKNILKNNPKIDSVELLPEECIHNHNCEHFHCHEVTGTDFDYYIYYDENNDSLNTYYYSFRKCFK